MIRVQVKNGNFDGAYKRFEKQVSRSGVPSERRKKNYFEKPGVIRRRKKAAACKKNKNYRDRAA